ncbi:MAG TPA: beta-ribofuranosylaminobenzene 5'-phosphate synthase family protein, partial [Vicinamibacteria bacterium]
MTETRVVFVEAPARLHMGLIDLRGDFGRRFGGLGAALEAPSLLLEARAASELSVTGEGAERVREYARRFLDHEGIAQGAAVRVHRSIPAHAGLGSGTQLALATARALSALFGRSWDVPALAQATGRAQRSAIGTFAFEQGGFLLEGGRKTGSDRAAPLLLRRALPAEWRCVIAIPPVPRGLNGPAEEEAFKHLPAPPAEIVGRISQLVLMAVLPALVEEDLAGFGRGITEVQRLVGETFLPVQGARFAHPAVGELVEALLQAGAAGAGQSSWGPAAFGLFAGEAGAAAAVTALADRG